MSAFDPKRTLAPSERISLSNNGDQMRTRPPRADSELFLEVQIAPCSEPHSAAPAAMSWDELSKAMSAAEKKIAIKSALTTLLHSPERR
jgi:hypothetical protein